ncbi:MAG: hypothetical protein RIR96_218 [Bacteroidota bacterium]
MPAKEEIELYAPIWRNPVIQHKLFFMRKIWLSTFLSLFILVSKSQQKTELKDTSILAPIEVMSLRNGLKSPFVSQTLDKKELTYRNTGVDLPYVLQHTPSLIASSDAGNGIGYTNLRIRGTDATRINITLNGVPFNDAESQGSFLVNIPDIVSSAASIQIQRGVGSSTNGTGAFGGSVNIQTNEVDSNRSLILRQSFGSFKTLKNTLLFNSGLLKNNMLVTLRASQIRSDGYVDRASSNLQALYLSVAKVEKNHTLRFNLITGKEKTYAAWFGINKATLDSNRRFNPAGTEKTGESYDNETDNYKQTHYQFFHNQRWNDHWKSGSTLFLTTGKGYFEQYKSAQDWESYSLLPKIVNNDTITQSDLVRQLWLDNIFYGYNYAIEYNDIRNKLMIGGTINRYDGKHFGMVKQVYIPQMENINQKWYDLTAQKSEASVFVKNENKWNTHFSGFVDLQFRHVNYVINGFRNNPNLQIRNNFNFFNPKLGISYFDKKWKVYLSYSRGSKEPNRDDFEAGNANQPKPEFLNDFEAGVEQKSDKYEWSINIYHMAYKDQLVLTGKVNDVFAYTRSNIANSYRTGVELNGKIQLTPKISFLANATFSENIALDYTEFTDDYDAGIQQSTFFERTPLAFSPSIQGSSSVFWQVNKKISLALFSKFCGRQFLDNTGDQEKSLDSWLVHDLRFDMKLMKKRKFSMDMFTQVNNILSEKYTPNGYTYTYIYGNTINKDNYFYPMSTIHFLIGVNLELTK